MWTESAMKTCKLASVLKNAASLHETSFHNYAYHLHAVNPQEENPNPQTHSYKLISFQQHAFIHLSPHPKPPHYHHSDTAKQSCAHSYIFTPINDEFFLTLWKWNCALCTAQKTGDLNCQPLLCMLSPDREVFMDCMRKSECIGRESRAVTAGSNKLGEHHV